MLTVGNALPSITDCQITPSSPASTDVLTASASGWSDPDNDPEGYTYNWRIKDASGWVDLGVTTATLPASETNRGDKLKVECTPFDGIESGTALTSDAVEVLNSAPVITDCTLNPNPADTEDKLKATPTGLSDADGDPTSVNYEWRVNGTVQTNVTGDSLNKSKTKRVTSLRLSVRSTMEILTVTARPMRSQSTIAPRRPRMYR